MINKVLVLGHLGLVTNPYDGQTIKTRNVYELLKSNRDKIGSVKYFDTQSFKSNLFSPFNMLWMILHCNKLVYIPAHNNLKYIFPFINIICKLKRIEILYIVVGGWLDEYLSSKKIYSLMLSKIKGIFTESSQLADNLRNRYNFKNVITFPNFRMHSFVPSFNENPETFKIVFMARIFREKGVDTVFRLADYIQNNYGNEHRICIDFYGPIQNDEGDYFRKELKKYNFVSYKCVLEPSMIYQTLDQYDLLVFPSRYSDEGFPGTIMDAFISGIPVIISNWRFMPEYVDDGFSGYIFDLDKDEDFYSKVDHLYKDRVQLLKMKHYAYEKSKEYSSESAWQIIEKYLVR